MQGKETSQGNTQKLKPDIFTQSSSSFKHQERETNQKHAK